MCVVIGGEDLLVPQLENRNGKVGTKKEDEDAIPVDPPPVVPSPVTGWVQDVQLSRKFQESPRNRGMMPL